MGIHITFLILLLYNIHQAYGGLPTCSPGATQAGSNCKEEVCAADGMSWTPTNKDALTQSCCQTHKNDECYSLFPALIKMTTEATTLACSCTDKVYFHDICGQYAYCTDCGKHIIITDKSEERACCEWTKTPKCWQLFPDLGQTSLQGVSCTESDTHVTADCWLKKCVGGKWQQPEPAYTEQCCTSTFTSFPPGLCVKGIYDIVPVVLAEVTKKPDNSAYRAGSASVSAAILTALLCKMLA